MKKFEILALSDTHLGEDTSLLSYSHGRQHLWKSLRDQSDDEKLEVEELILIGDIPDRTLSSTAQIITHTNAFVRMIGSAASKVNKCVYIPGNHDHSLWTNYIDRRYGERTRITSPAGEPIVEKGRVQGIEKEAEELLTVFFGYPLGSSWRRIVEEEYFNFSVANPVYAKELNGRTYVFTHGTHFRADVSAPEIIKKILDYMQLDEILAKIEIDSDCDVNEAKNLEELEKTVAGFTDTLWPSSKNNPTSRSDQLWYILTSLSGKFGKKRSAPDNSRSFSWNDLQNGEEERIKRLDKNDASIERCEKHFLGHLASHLERHNFLNVKNSLTFVYGDTHDGGYGAISSDSVGDMRIFNTGGWAIHNVENHPACHVFTVDNNGNEALLDISFKDVKVLGEPLLDTAAKDAENRYKETNRLFRILLKLLDKLL